MEKIKNNLETFFTTWAIVLILNQVFIFGGCFRFYCLLAALPHTGIISAFITYFYLKSEEDEEAEQESEPKPVTRNRKKEHPKAKPAKKNQNTKKTQPENDYEKLIGRNFEEKEDTVVIYNGFIKGYEDEGINIVVISSKEKTINLVQCKYWMRKEIKLDDIKNIYAKLDVDYNNFDLYYLSSEDIYHQTQIQNTSIADIDKTMDDLRKNITSYTIRKTLYAANDKVVDLPIGEHLTMLNPNIFKYKDMKVVFYREL